VLGELEARARLIRVWVDVPRGTLSTENEFIPVGLIQVCRTPSARPAFHVERFWSPFHRDL